MIPPVFQSYHDDELKGFTQDLDKAKKLLDDAGYKDVDDDGLREDKDGNKLTIKLCIGHPNRFLSIVGYSNLPMVALFLHQTSKQS